MIFNGTYTQFIHQNVDASRNGSPRTGEISLLFLSHAVPPFIPSAKTQSNTLWSSLPVQHSMFQSASDAVQHSLVEFNCQFPLYCTFVIVLDTYSFVSIFSIMKVSLTIRQHHERNSPYFSIMNVILTILQYHERNSHHTSVS